MIYRFSQNITSESTILEMMEKGVKLNFDDLWCNEKSAGKWANQKNEWDRNPKYFGGLPFLAVFTGFLSAGIVPAVAGIFYGIQKAQKNMEEKKDEENDIITVSADEIFFFVDKIKAKVSELVKQGHKVDVVVDGNAEFEQIDGDEKIEYNLSVQQYLKIFDLNEELKKLGMKNSIKFNEYFETTKYTDLKACWDLDQVLDATSEIDKVVWKIKDRNLSPYETMLYIHKYVTSRFGYGFNAKDNRKNKAERNRSIVGALKNRQTVCAGFASLTKAIIDKLDMPGLKCNYQVVEYLGKDGKKTIKSGHVLNIVDIEDEKYGINGKYANDSTWDCKTKEAPRGRGYSFFMYPILDMDMLRERELTLSECFSRSHIEYMSSYKKDLKKEEQREMSSPPISLDKLKKAMTKVYSVESDFSKNDVVEKLVEEDIARSLKRAWTSRISCENPLVKEANEIYNINVKTKKNGTLKSVDFSLKNKSNTAIEQ